MQSSITKLEDDMATMRVSDSIPFNFTFNIKPYLARCFEPAMIEAIQQGEERMEALLDIDVVNMYLSAWYPLVAFIDEDIEEDQDDFSNILATELLNEHVSRMLRSDVVQRFIAWRGRIHPALTGGCFNYVWSGELLITNNVPHYDYTCEKWCQLLDEWGGDTGNIAY